jgi:putative ABC transport system substrate-binding protein
MRRRDFIKVLAGSAMTWSLAARAQQSEHMRRIGVLMGYAESGSSGPALIAAFREGLQKNFHKMVGSLQLAPYFLEAVHHF